MIRERDHGYVFGGYADAPWPASTGRIDALGRRIGSNGGAFLFALRCFAGLPPTRMGLRGGNNECGMVAMSGSGPSFGVGELGLSRNLNEGYSGGVAPDDDDDDGGGGSRAYRMPEGLQGLQGEGSEEVFLAGGKEFRVGEVEVYTVTQPPAPPPPLQQQPIGGGPPPPPPLPPPL